MKPAPGVVGWSGLAGWSDDDLTGALDAYRLSAPPAILPAPDEKPRVFFERAFAPGPSSVAAFYTAYYEPELEGRLAPGESYRHPLFASPPNLPSDRPWFSRTEIEVGNLLAGREIVWLDSALEAFLAQVQGSVRVRLPDGTALRLGYAGKNGHPYRSIGQELIARGVGRDGKITVDEIRAWAKAHPADLPALLRTNPSFVFFRPLDLPAELGPITTSGAPATPMRTLAVDPDYVPLGLPVWVETPDWACLMIAQDTGSAIKGAGRGDIFLGSGSEAGRRAGAFQRQGRMTVLHPRSVGGVGR